MLRGGTLAGAAAISADRWIGIVKEVVSPDLNLLMWSLLKDARRVTSL